MKFSREFQFRRRFQVIHIQHSVILTYTSTYLSILAKSWLLIHQFFKSTLTLKGVAPWPREAQKTLDFKVHDDVRYQLSKVACVQSPEYLMAFKMFWRWRFFLKHAHGTRGRFESQLLIGPFKYSRLSHGMMCFGVDASHWSNATITKGKIKVEWTDLSDTETCKTCKTDHVLKAQLTY